MTDWHPHTLARTYCDHGNDWANKEASASLLEETRKSVRAQLACGYFEQAKAVNKAELMAEADPLYIEHIQKMVEARRVANLAKVQYDADEAFINMVRTKESTARAEMNMR